MCDSERRGTGRLRSSGRKNTLLQQRCMLQGLMALLLFVISSTAVLHAEEQKSQPLALLDQIWPHQYNKLLTDKRPLSKRDQEYAEAALIQWLEAYLEPGYKVLDKQFFWSERNSAEWVAISKGHALYPENENGRWRVLEEIEQSWRTPGSGLVRLWKVSIGGKDHYFAIAMTDQPVPGTRGRRLISRFELKKMIE
jgi:hypothetical protein